MSIFQIAPDNMTASVERPQVTPPLRELIDWVCFPESWRVVCSVPRADVGQQVLGGFENVCGCPEQC